MIINILGNILGAWLIISFLINIFLLPMTYDIIEEKYTYIIPVLKEIWKDNDLNFIGKIIITITFFPMGVFFSLTGILIKIFIIIITWHPNKKS